MPLWQSFAINMHSAEKLLTPRLKMVASLVPQSSTLCDIGTDHAYIAIYLVKEGIAKKVIASDINRGPLMQAQKNITLYGESEFIETRLSDGLCEFDYGEVQTAVIAGMGGETIAEIMSNDKGIENFVLQPQSAHSELRTFLYENGYVINNEKICREGRKMYIAMAVSRGKMKKLSLAQSEIGPVLLRDRPPLFEDYVRYRLYEIDSIYKKIKNSDAKERISEILMLKKTYEDLLND